jgi:hypothetical protein
MNSTLKHLVVVGSLLAGVTVPFLTPQTGADARPMFDRCPPASASHCHPHKRCIYVIPNGHVITLQCHRNGHKK